MTSTAKISSKSQLTVPAWARDRLGLRPGARVLLRVEGDRLILERLDKSIEDLEGSMSGIYGDADAYVAESRRDRATPP